MPITPYLYYEDVSAACGWLAKAFGFKREGRPMKDRDGTVRHAAMKLGDGVVMMGAPGANYKSPKRLGQATQSLYVMVEDADRHFARAKKSGGTILEEPADTEYGHRRYGMTDPEGHEWYFAHELKTARTRISGGRRARATSR